MNYIDMIMFIIVLFESYKNHNQLLSFKFLKKILKLKIIYFEEIISEIY